MWFTLSHGIFNEVYYPRIDQACLRDLGLLVSDGRTFFSEEKRDTVSCLEWVAPGVPAFRVENVCRLGRYRITKDIVSDPCCPNRPGTMPASVAVFVPSGHSFGHSRRFEAEHLEKNTQIS